MGRCEGEKGPGGGGGSGPGGGVKLRHLHHLPETAPPRGQRENRWAMRPSKIWSDVPADSYCTSCLLQTSRRDLR